MELSNNLLIFKPLPGSTVGISWQRVKSFIYLFVTIYWLIWGDNDNLSKEQNTIQRQYKNQSSTSEALKIIFVVCLLEFDRVILNMLREKIRQLI